MSNFLHVLYVSVFASLLSAFALFQADHVDVKWLVTLFAFSTSLLFCGWRLFQFIKRWRITGNGVRNLDRYILRISILSFLLFLIIFFSTITIYGDLWPDELDPLMLGALGMAIIAFVSPVFFSREFGAEHDR